MNRRQLLKCMPLAALAPVAPLWAAGSIPAAVGCARDCHTKAKGLEERKHPLDLLCARAVTPLAEYARKEVKRCQRYVSAVSKQILGHKIPDCGARGDGLNGADDSLSICTALDRGEASKRGSRPRR